MKPVMEDQYGKETANKYENIVVEYAYGYEECLNAVCTELFMVQYFNRRVDKLKILDLGAGTGRLSRKLAFFAEKHGVDAKFDLFDSSEEMLSQARELWGFSAQVNLLCGDFGELESKVVGRYDLIVSSFALHHLFGNEKIRCFKIIKKILNPGGVFIVADRMVDEDGSYYLDHLCVAGYHARALFEQISGRKLELDELPEFAHQQFKQDGDTPESVEKHREYLSEAGFIKVKSPYFNFGNGVLLGHRPV